MNFINLQLVCFLFCANHAIALTDPVDDPIHLERLIPNGPTGEIILDPTVDSFYYDILMGGAPGNDEDSQGKDQTVSKYEQYGQAVAMGDFNGDGITDMVVSALWARKVDMVNGAPVYSKGSAGKIYIIYGDAITDATTPLDPAMQRYGSSSDHEGYHRTLHPDFYDENGPNFDTPWYNLFDVEGERRSADDGGESGTNRLSGAVLYGQFGYRDVGSTTASGEVVTDVVDIISSKTDDGYIGNYFQDQWAPGNDPETFENSLVTVSDQVGDLTGRAIANAGDVNGDGIDDLLIGAESYSHPAYEPTAEQLGLSAGSVPLAFGNDAGIVYLIFGSDSQVLTGAHNLSEVGVSIPGVKFIGAGVHMKVGRDVSSGSSMAGEDVFLDFNNDGLADFLIGSQSLDSGEALANLNPAGNLTGPHSVDDPDGDGDTSDAHIYLAAIDPKGIGNGIGGSYIIYGEQLSVGDADLNPWNKTEFYLPTEFATENLPAPYSNTDGNLDGACIIGHHQFGYLGYVGFGGDFNGDGTGDIVIGAPNHDRDTSGGVGNNQERGEFYVVFGAGGGDELRGIHEARRLVGAEIGTSDKTRAISIMGDLNTVDDYEVGFDPDGNFSVDLSVQGSDMGWSVMTAGDVDNDGFSDVLMGAPDQSSALGVPRSTGEACLLYGFSPMLISESTEDYFYDVDDFLSLSNPSGSGKVGTAEFGGVYNGDSTGEQVFCAGDINEDGFDDFLISAPEADHMYQGVRYTDVGAVYLIYGRERDGLPGELVGSLSLADVGSTIDGAVFYGDHIAEERWETSPYWTTPHLSDNPDHYDENHVLHNPPHVVQTELANAGTWIVGGFDMDGDGIDDLMIGVPNATRVNESWDHDQSPVIQLPDMGAAFIVYGGSQEQLMDSDCDGVVDIADYIQYVSVYNGNSNPEAICRYTDLNRDGDIDCDDLQLFEDALGLSIPVAGCD